MFTSVWWKDTLERAVSTLAQVFLGILTAEKGDLNNVFTQQNLIILGVAFASVFLKAMAASGKTDTISPASLVKE